MKTEITAIKCTGKHPLYRIYPRQLNPQDAYIELDPESAELSADWNAEVGNAIPMPVYHRRILRYPVTPYLTSEEANTLMEEISPLALIVCNEYSEAWDGSNMVGQLTEEGEEASEAIREICAEAETNSEGPEEEEN
jgi:hypothetical protein